MAGNIREIYASLLVVMIFKYAECQTTGDICSYQSPTMINSITLEASETSNWSEDDSCRCVIAPNFNSSEGLYRVLTMSVDFVYSSSSEDIPHCLPMLQVSSTRKSVPAQSYPLGITYSVCPGIGKLSRHTATSMMYKGQQLVLHLYNSGRQKIINKITIDEFAGTMSVQCQQYERIMYEEEACPCTSTDQYIWGGPIGRPSQFDETRRLIIGLVTAFLFALIIIAIIVGCFFYKKRRAKKEQSKMEAMTVENKAYEGSKQSVASEPKQPPPQKEPIVSFTPDPGLNLKLQQPGHHGSKDSGLASSNDTTDKEKRLPFMQPPPASHSLDDINQMPANYPSLAGQGSQSSLDHIDPEYTTRPGDSANKPRSGHKQEAAQNFPPLAGHGSQHSLDNPLQYPGDVNPYAIPVKRSQREPKSGSLDKLNDAVTLPAKEEQFHSAESLNVHTEV